MKHNFLKATEVLAATTFSVISSETISQKNHKSMRKYILTLVSVLFSLLFGISLSAQEFFRIAAHDSSEESKKSADIVCTGEHDELTIQKVLDGSDWVDTMGNAAEPLKPSFDRALIPQPVFDAEPGYVELYWKAWEQAYAHVKWQKGLVQPLYMDEGLWDDTIWIWDSEFMVMFCKYAPKLFPGIQTLDNFYYTMLEDSGSSLRIQHPDNPPFFAWVENDYYKITGDRDHIRELLLDKKFPQRYWDLFPTLSPERKLQFDHYPIALKYKGIGYEWSGISSGMDNTPRTRAGKGMLWVDAISQQALSALYISRLAKVAGDGATAREFEKKWKELRGIVNKYYWDDSDGCYYDIVPAPSGETASVADVQASPSAWRTTGILTPASFWPMLAEIPSKAQARRMTEFALRPDKLGGEVPWVTVSRDDPDFDANDGWYWRGSMWLPTAYMGIKALEKYGFQEAADTTAEKVLSWMLRTYCDYEPHTIWECYSPTAPTPSSNHGKRVRPDFCGWSALGPISLFIENVLGFHDIDASSRTVRWDIRHDCRHGLNNLTFGDTTTDLLYDPAAATVTIRSNKPYCLILNGKSHRIRAGVTTISI
jgi:alpha,alpha-trehalase